MTKNETTATEATKAEESTANRRRWLAWLAAASSVAAILAALNDVHAFWKFAMGLFERERNECSLSMDQLGGQAYIETRNDALDGSCSTKHYPDGEYAKYYEFELARAATVTMEMTSRDVDSWLVLRSGLSPGIEVLEKDDDGGDGVDARIERSLDAGTYTIETTTVLPGETGDFTLTVTVDLMEECSLSMGMLGRRAYIHDALDGSCRTAHYQDGEYAKYYEFTLDRPATVIMEMTSQNVNSRLALRSESSPGSAEELAEENGDGEDGGRARIERSLDLGTYTIEATTLSAGETGDFTLTVDRTDVGCSLSIGSLERTDTDIKTRNGTLDGSCSSEYYSAGEYAMYYEFTLDREATVTMEMTSPDVDSWLALRKGPRPGRSEEQEERVLLEENDDGGDGVDARIERSLDAGIYTIETTTWRPGETGDYTLTVTVDPLQ